MNLSTSYHHGDLRAALLEAAEQELAEKGVEAFSLRGVARRAGVSHGAPAHHYGDVRGLLTAMAARGYELFISAQRKRQETAQQGAHERLVAAGLGYIDFALERPALFRLMFASERPDRTSSSLADGASAAFDKLVADVSLVQGGDPHSERAATANVMAVWATVHGLAELMLGNRFDRMAPFAGMDTDQRERLFGELILRSAFDGSEKLDD